VAALRGALAAALRAYADADVTALPDSALLDDVQGLLAARDLIDGLVARRLEVVHVREAAVSETGLTTKAWLIAHCRRSAHEAGQRMFVARSLAGLPALAATFEAGECGLDAARIVASALRDVPESERPAAEGILVELARQAPPGHIATAAGEVVRRLIDQEAAEAAAQRRFEQRHLSIAKTFGGMVALSGLLDPESGEVVLSAIGALAQKSGSDDSRTPGQRRADALVELAGHRLACPGLPGSAGERPQLVVTMAWETLAARLGDAVLERSGLPLSASAARRLACDAAVIPAVLGSDGAVLDVGRAVREWPIAIRRAARLRDRGCSFPGCVVGLDGCELHHIVHWAEGGETSLANSAHLCRFHHRLVHELHWTMRRSSPTEVVFTDPHGRDERAPPVARAG
jgi:hypothetical protein